MSDCHILKWDISRDHKCDVITLVAASNVFCTNFVGDMYMSITFSN